MQLESFLGTFEADDYKDWFSRNLDRQSQGKSVYPNMLFINRFLDSIMQTREYKDVAITEIWRVKGKRGMELLYKREVKW